MCGIAGFVAQGVFPESSLLAMVGSIEHRGPDDSGFWIDAARGVALGHRRLSILDLSPLGHQPMESGSGRYVITYNGEIYNFVELKKELSQAGHRFRGTSDTEVLLAAIEQWGMTAALQRFNGMFAFAAWDKKERAIHIARDRIGIKPLYYGWVGGALVFASELKAIRRYNGFSGAIDKQALLQMMRHGYVSAPRTIYRNIHKLLPGTLLSLPCNDLGLAKRDFSPAIDSDRRFRPKRYWSLARIAAHGIENPFAGGDREAIEALELQLGAAVRRRMVSDVPLGAFLSGGIDSSLIVSLMQAYSAQPIKTFTVGFDVSAYDESAHARRVAQHLGTDHTEHRVSGSEALDVIPRLPEMFDEPFADSSQVPTFLVAQLARQRVTVSLAGDGADELFAGYNRYTWPPRLWKYLRLVPHPLRGGIASGLTALSPARWDRLGKTCNAILPSGLRFSVPGEKAYKLARTIHASGADDLYGRLMTQWEADDEIVLGADLDRPEPGSGLDAAFAERMMLRDIGGYLPDDLLAKADRASMAVSLEVRVPMLDHEFVAFAWSLPYRFKYRDGTSKWLLRELLYRYVPKALIDRPKMGFSVPIDSWLRGPLRDWGEALLDSNRLREQGLLNVPLVRAAWDDHLAKRANRQNALWNVLMFQAWLESDTSYRLAA